MRGRLACVGGAALLLGGLLPAQAAAETRMVAGEQLVLTTDLSDGVVIATDAALAGHVRLTMQGSLSCLSVVGGQAAVIGTSGCDDGQLRVEVSPDTLVTLTSTGDGDIRVADLRGLLVATLNGGGSLTAGHTGGVVLGVRGDGDATVGQVDGPATLDMTSGGDVRLVQVRGPLTVRQAGSGDLVVGGIEGPAVSLDAGGSGDMLLGAGRIGSLRARFGGSGDLSVAATVHDADVQAHGSSDVRLAAVTGAFDQQASGSATIKLEGADGARTIEAAITGKLRRGATGEGRSSGMEPLLLAVLLGIVAFIGWRILRRPGGFAALRVRPGAVAGHPGVIALGETMARLDQRLGAIESYVTTREFDLNRKFREL